MIEFSQAKTVLVVSHYYYPDVNPRANRWSSICAHLASNGWQVIVISRKTRFLSKKETIDGVQIYRVTNIAHYFSLYENLAEQQPESLVDISNNSSLHQPSTFREFIVRLSAVLLQSTYRFLARIWYLFRWPDEACLWIVPAALKATKLIAKYRPSIVIGVSWPFSAQLATVLAFQASDSNAKLVLDSGDPFSFASDNPPNNFFIYSILNRWAERNLISASTFFSVTTDETASLYHSSLNIPNSKLRVIPPIVRVLPNNAQQKISHTLATSSVINLCYLGQFHSKIRRPYYFFEVLNQIITLYPHLSQTLTVSLVGSYYEWVKTELSLFNSLAGIVNFLPKVPHRQALEYMSCSSALINIGNSTSYQVPSKLPEYLLSGRPIINFSNIDGDSSESLLSDCDNVFFCRCHKSLDYPSLYNFIITSNEMAASPEFINKIASRYSVQSISDLYLS